MESAATRLIRCKNLLLDFGVPVEGHTVWLLTPLEAFGGRSPMQMIDEDDYQLELTLWIGCGITIQA